MGLKGFLTESDLNNIKLKTNNLKLEYETKESSENIPLKIVEDETIQYQPEAGFKVSDDYYFTLTGTGSQNYVISRDSYPKLVSSIIPRSINVVFNNIIKEYDGTTSINPNINHLYYNITPTSNEHSGLVLGNKSVKYSLSLESSYIDNSRNVTLDYQEGDLFYAHLESYSYDQKLPEFKLIEDETFIFKLTYNDAKIMSIPYNYDESTGLFSLSLPDTKRFPISDKSNPNGNNDNYVNYPEGNQNYSLTSTSDKGQGLTVVTSWKVSEVKEDGDNTSDKYFVDSDFLKFLVECEDIQYSTKDVTTGMRPLIFSSAQLKPGPRGDCTNNYKINNITGFGKIVPRTVVISFDVINKIYDGTTKAEITNLSYYNIIEGDEVILSNDFEFLHSNVGEQYLSIITPKLTGKDSKNYLGIIRNQGRYKANITPKSVNITINYVRISRHNNEFQISYLVDGMISGDDVHLDLSESQITIKLENGSTTTYSDVFLNDWFTYNNSVITWNTSYDKIKLTRKVDGDTSTIIEGDLVNLSNLKLSGKDAYNYNLENTTAKTRIYFY